MINEEQLLESKELRNQLASKVEVLEKVKTLLLIPQTDVANIKQIAEFYEVDESNIKMTYSRHKDELDNDGTEIKSYKDFLKSQPVTLEMTKGKATIVYNNNDKMEVPMRGLRVFPRRAILRIGMLLRDSKVAAEVRTQLLNIEEKTSTETKTQDIDEEQKLAIEIGMNYISGNIEQFAKSSMALINFKNRHIDKLKQDNKALSGQILQWKDRSKMVYAIRKLSGKLHKQIGVVWNELYKNLYYQYSISVKARGGTPYIEHVRENEWDKVIKTFSAMCEANDISPSEIFEDVMTEVIING